MVLLGWTLPNAALTELWVAAQPAVRRKRKELQSSTACTDTAQRI